VLTWSKGDLGSLHERPVAKAAQIGKIFQWPEGHCSLRRNERAFFRGAMVQVSRRARLPCDFSKETACLSKLTNSWAPCQLPS